MGKRTIRSPKSNALIKSSVRYFVLESRSDWSPALDGALEGVGLVFWEEVLSWGGLYAVEGVLSTDCDELEALDATAALELFLCFLGHYLR